MIGVVTASSWRLRRMRPWRALVFVLCAGCRDATLDTQQQQPTQLPPSAHRTSLVVVPAAIDPTGSRDVTKALQAYLELAPDSATIRFPDSARYRVEGTLVLQGRHSLTLEGNGTTFLANT